MVLPVVRIKNKFAFLAGGLNGRQRDLMLSVIYEGQYGLRIIGEIQVLIYIALMPLEQD